MPRHRTAFPACLTLLSQSDFHFERRRKSFRRFIASRFFALLNSQKFLFELASGKGDFLCKKGWASASLHKVIRFESFLSTTVPHSERFRALEASRRRKIVKFMLTFRESQRLIDNSRYQLTSKIKVASQYVSKISLDSLIRFARTSE